MKKIIAIKKVSTFFDPSLDIDFDQFKKIDLIKNSNIKKILIIKWGGMGDVIQSSAVINNILDHFRGLKVDLNTLPSWQVFYKSNKKINKVWGITFKKGLSNLSTCFKWLKIVKTNNYDLIIDLQTNDRSRILLSILKLFFYYPKFLVGNHDIYPYNLRSNSKLKIDNPLFVQQRTISIIGIKPTNTIPKLSENKNSSANVKKILKCYNLKKNNFFIFIPGCSKSNTLKRWGSEKFIKLGELLVSLKKKIVLIGGIDDIQVCSNIAESNADIVNLCGKFNLHELIYLFKNGLYVIANDTGPTHLAACATSTPIIQITGPTDPLKVKPFGSKIISLQSDIECKNCYKKACSHHSCMHNIQPNFIFNIIKQNI